MQLFDIFKNFNCFILLNGFNEDILLLERFKTIKF
jgi:hypothetical protein